MKKVAYLALVASLVLTLSVGCGNSEEETNNNEQKNQEIVKEQNMNGVSITNITLTTQDNTTTYQATVTNATEEVKHVTKIDITLKDKDGNVIGTSVGFVDADLQPTEARIIQCNFDGDLTQTAVSVDYVVE